MKKIATTQLFSSDGEIYFNEYEDGSYKKVIDEIEADSSLEELQELIGTGKYKVTEMMW